MVAAKKATLVAKPKKAKKGGTVKAKPVKVEQKIKVDVCDFNFLELSTAIDDISYKIDNVKSTVELLAGELSDFTHSGAAWGVSDALGVHLRSLEDLSSRIMEAHRTYGKVTTVSFSDFDFSWRPPV